MRQYTLNRRGRIIFIHTPLTLLFVTVLTTNAIEFIGFWTRQTLLQLIDWAWPW